MARSQANEQARVNAGIVALAIAALEALWPGVDWDSPDAVTAIQTHYVAVITEYGQASASAAANFYDQARAEKKLRTKYDSIVARPNSREHLDAIVAAAFNGGDDGTGVLTVDERALRHSEYVERKLTAQAQRLVRRPGRRTTSLNAANDPAKNMRFIRVPTGEKTCELCTLLASRQIIPSGRAKFGGYTSKDAALFTENGDRYHDWCDCEAIAFFPGDDLATLSPHMSAYKAEYEAGAETAGTTADLRQVLAGMRANRAAAEPEPPAPPDPPSA